MWDGTMTKTKAPASERTKGLRGIPEVALWNALIVWTLSLTLHPPPPSNVSKTVTTIVPTPQKIPKEEKSAIKECFLINDADEQEESCSHLRMRMSFGETDALEQQI